MEKEFVFLGATICLKFIQGACVLVIGLICVAVVEFLKFEQVELFSNMCWSPWRGMEIPEGL
jgi:hypothetical protein